MKFYSTNKISPRADFREATIQGLAPDKGLYFPEIVPVLDRSFIDNLSEISNEEIAFTVIAPYVGNCIPEGKLRDIVNETVNFPVPLVVIDNNISALELFHGPTLAFKDFGARFMSRCLGYFMQSQSKKITVLVATSGDTGGAVANGFLNVDGVDVVILYPSGKVSKVQELQLTTNAGNVTAVEVNGTFDDCQRLVKTAFADPEINKSKFLTSANSINISRWLSQQFYYFFAVKQWEGAPPVFSVPSGNLGNICAGLLAHQSGLPACHFIAACNANAVIKSYLETGSYKSMLAQSTISNAMDVGDPSNFVRIVELFAGKFPAITEKLTSFSISDADTVSTMQSVLALNGYLLDPHGAVAYAALKKYLANNPGKAGIFLETAHPVKFPSPDEEHNAKIMIPESIKNLLKKTKSSITMDPEFELFKEFLLK